jgi:hypothetical protein
MRYSWALVKLGANFDIGSKVFILCPNETIMKLNTRNWGIGQWMMFIVLSTSIFSHTLAGGNMQNAVTDLTCSIVEHGSCRIDGLQTNSPDVAYFNEHYYSGMAPGLSWLQVPIYFISKFVVSVLPDVFFEKWNSFSQREQHTKYSILKTPHAVEQYLTHSISSLLLGSIGSLFLFYALVLIARHFSYNINISKSIGLLFMFGTFFLFYSSSYYTQSVALVFLVVGLYHLFVSDISYRNFIAGFSISMAGTIDYPFYIYGAIILLCYVVYWLLHKPKKSEFLYLVLGASIPFACLLYYHSLCFDNILSTPYAFRINQFHHAGFLGIGTPQLGKLYQLLFSPSEGLLIICPFIVFAPMGIFYFLQRSKHDSWSNKKKLFLKVLLLLIIVNIAYYTCVPWSNAMASFGPRFLLMSLPFIILFSYPYYLGKYTWLFYLLVAWSVIYNVMHLISNNTYILDLKNFAVKFVFIQIIGWKGIAISLVYFLAIFLLVNFLYPLVSSLFVKAPLNRKELNEKTSTSNF